MSDRENDRAEKWHLRGGELPQRGGEEFFVFGCLGGRSGAEDSVSSSMLLLSELLVPPAVEIVARREFVGLFGMFPPAIAGVSLGRRRSPRLLHDPSRFLRFRV